MKIAAIIFFFILIGVMLFRGLKSPRFNQDNKKALIETATVLAALAAILVFVFPAAQPPTQPPPSANKNESHIKPSLGNGNANQLPNNTAQKPEASNIQTNQNSAQNTNAAGPNKLENADEVSVKVKQGQTLRVFQNQIFISVREVTITDRVYATIGAPGFPNVDIKGEGIGFMVPYRADSRFEVRVTGIQYVGSTAEFLVMRIK